MDLRIPLKYVKNAQLKLAFQSLEAHSHEFDVADQQTLILLQNRFNRLYEAPFIGWEEQEVTLNRIVFSLIALISELGDNQFPDAEIPTDVELKKIVNTSLSRWVYKLHKPFFQQFHQANKEIEHMLSHRLLPDEFEQQLSQQLTELENIQLLAKRLNDQLSKFEQSGGNPAIVQEGQSQLAYIYQSMSLLELTEMKEKIEGQIRTIKQELSKGKRPIYLVAIVLIILSAMVLLGIFSLE